VAHRTATPPPARAGSGRRARVAHRDWYRTFFEGVALDLWDLAVTPEQTRAEADFLERALAPRRGARLLDGPCGAGRHALELAGRGYRVTGVDLSREQIARARARTVEGGRAPGRRRSGAGRLVEWVHADMRDLPPAGGFDGAYCLGNSFGYFDPDGTRAFIRAVAQALDRGGRFAMDTGMAAESILPNFKEKEEHTIGDILFLEENRYHPAESCIETRYTFARAGRATTRTGLQWVYTLQGIRALLAEEGLETREVAGSLDGAPFTLGAPILLLVARKR
jgi:SAM-dependent methyltransferase